MNVLDLSWLEDGAELGPEELQPLSRTMAASLQQLIEERDKAAEVWEGQTTATIPRIWADPPLCLLSSMSCTDFLGSGVFNQLISSKQNREQESERLGLSSCDVSF